MPLLSSTLRAFFIWLTSESCVLDNFGFPFVWEKTLIRRASKICLWPLTPLLLALTVTLYWFYSDPFTSLICLWKKKTWKQSLVLTCGGFFLFCIYFPVALLDRRLCSCGCTSATLASYCGNCLQSRYKCTLKFICSWSCAISFVIINGFLARILQCTNSTLLCFFVNLTY